MKTVDELLGVIEKELVRSYPLTAKAANVNESVYALILFYADTTTDDPMPYAEIAPECVRKWAVERTGDKAGWNIWKPGQEISGARRLVKSLGLQGDSLRANVRACYRLLSADDSVDDDVRLEPFRAMMCRVARTLNGHDWRGILNTTDDFAVIASDWTALWLREDAVNSLPPEKRSRLESRGLFFPEHTEGEREEAARKFDAVQAELASRPEAERIAYWIGELDRLAAGERRLLDDWAASVSGVLRRLRAIGGSASPLLLDLAARLDALPGQTDGLPSPAAIVLSAAFETVQEIGRADQVVERSLRTLLAASCRANEGREFWSATPFRCAYCLARLFDGYDFPYRDSNGVLQEADTYLSAMFATGEAE